MCDPGADLVPALLTVSVLPAAADPDDDGKVAAATPATHPFSLLSLSAPVCSTFPLWSCVREGAAWSAVPVLAYTVMRPVLVTTKKIFVSDHGP